MDVVDYNFADLDSQLDKLISNTINLEKVETFFMSPFEQRKTIEKNPANYELKKTQQAHQDEIVYATTLSDGMILTASLDSYFHVWDPARLICLNTFEGHTH